MIDKSKQEELEDLVATLEGDTERLRRYRTIVAELETMNAATTARILLLCVEIGL